MLGVRISGWSIVAIALFAWLLPPLLLGGSTGGVETGSTYALDASGNPDPNQHQPRCVSAHVFNAREWGSFETIRYDVSVHGCNDSNGRLQLTSSPTCSASSFLGPGSATCTASPDGDKLKVTVDITYPFGLGLIAGYPNPSTFYMDPGGGYSTY